jgi:peptide deformylase
MSEESLTLPKTKDTMQIVHYPHPALRWKSKPVTEINADLRATVARMFELMYESKGIGLAANQVALPYRMFVINITSDPELSDEELVFINPEIIKRTGSEEGEEGCLSLPEIYGQVRRAEEIVVEAFDLDGRGFEMTLDDLGARVVQHETDHIDGVLFVDRMSDTARRELDGPLGDMESYFRRQQEAGKIPGDEELKRQLRALETK